MPRRFFRKFAFKRHEYGDKWFLSPFRHLLHDHRLWGVRRKNVVPAVALGAFFAALALRVTIPIAALTTFISNPLTMGPMYFFAYRLGVRLLGAEQKPFEMEMSLDWVTHTFVNIWQPMLLGCLLLGATAALIAYVTLDLVWRSSLGQYKSRKRQQRRDRES
jgi:uncharacterized protein (DUF2062 family)